MQGDPRSIDLLNQFLTRSATMVIWHSRASTATARRQVGSVARYNSQIEGRTKWPWLVV
jgi:hypothetical protein